MSTINSVGNGLSGSTGSGAFVGATAPTLTQVTFSTTAGIIGATTNNAANTGSVGEYVISEVQYNSPISITSTMYSTVTSISLTAGDWQVYGMLGFNIAATTVTNFIAGGISLNSAAAATNNNWALYVVPAVSPTAAYNGLQTPVPIVRVSLATTTTIYLVATSAFSVSTLSAYGSISARRMR